MTTPHFHTGPPAFTSLLPETPEPRPVSPALAAQIEAYCGISGEVQSLGPIGESAIGRYVISPPASAPLFLKVFDQQIVELQRHSDRVASFLSQAGVPVVLPLAGEPRAFAAGLSGELFPYVDARFSDCSETELRRLATIVARVHLALREYDEDATRTAGEEMHRRLLAVASAAPGAWLPGEFEPAVRDAMRRYSTGALAIHDAPQMVHGDCNYTNVLVARRGGDMWLIDFEESRAAWLNPLFDLAKIIERFVLVPGVENPERMAGAIVESYVDAGGSLPKTIDFRRVLLESNSRALLIMCDKAREGLELPAAEWRKFVELTALAEQHGPVLDAVSRTALSKGAAR